MNASLDPLGPEVRASTSLFADTGIFVWANSLARKGAVSPVRKVFVIGKTLAHASEMGARGTVWRADAHVDFAVGAGYARFGREHLVPLEDLRLDAEPQWDPHVALAEIMVAECGAGAIRSAKSRLDAAGVRLGYDELHDLSTVFVNSRLRDAVDAFDPVQGEGKEAAWLSTVLFRFALRHGLIARGLEFNLELASEVADPSPEPSEQLELAAEQKSLALLPAALARLPSLQQSAIRLYFGLDGREHAIKEVATALRTNSYYARLAVTSGLTGLASEMGAVGLLSQDDLGLAKALFIEGREASLVAADLGISRGELAKRTSAIAKQVSKSLRLRTVPPKIESSKGETEMSSTAVDLPALLREFKSGNLHFNRGDDGHVFVVGSPLHNPLPVESLREQLIEQVEELSHFGSELGEMMAEVFAPSPVVERNDVSPDQLEWIAMLSRAESESRQDATRLIYLMKREAMRKGIKIDGEQLDHAEARIRDSLATVSAALVESMPRRLRRTGSATLWIALGSDASQARFSWDGEEGGDSYPTLHSLIRQRLAMVGEFQGEALGLLATCVVESLTEGHSHLPDFDVAISRSKGGLRLEWSRPVARRLRELSSAG